MADTNSSQHAVAVIGGAVAGAQVAKMLAERGALVAVFEQNVRPFGKIEDGLPRWHSALRKKEYKNVTKLLSTPGIHFVPSTRIGKDISFKELTSGWGFSAVVLACGAWRDRPLPFEGANDFIGSGLIYQNPFIKAFNHAYDPAYDGPKFPIMDDAIVVGGGLASIDVVKLHMLETTRMKLQELGHELDTEEMEKAGLDKACAGVGVDWNSLGLKGCTLFYRRRGMDMPLQSIPDGADEARIAKVMANRAKIIERTIAKYKFKFVPLASPEAAIVENDRMVGLRFRRMQVNENRKLVRTDQTFDHKGSIVISSIGSIPQPIGGIDMKGELFAFTDWDLGQLEGYPTVFSAGNVVTGKGNIVASRRHATSIGNQLVESYLGLSDDGHTAETAVADQMAAATAEQAADIAEQIQALPPASPDALLQVTTRVQARQREVGYTGDPGSWVDAYPPS